MPAILFMKLMKKLLQIVAVVVVVVLAAQPALAGLPCAVGASSTAGCVPGCGMAMGQMSSTQMGPDCGMSTQISSDGCAQNCCIERLSQGFVQPASSAKSDTARALHFVPAALPLAIETQSVAVTTRTIPDSTPPARYILFQVFRI
jgi:hypothetical protein